MKSTVHRLGPWRRHRWYTRFWLGAVFILWFITGAAFAEPRIALVIGNGAYRDAPLKNPTNDAQDMAAKLRAIGFQVIERLDADRQSMRLALREFEQRLRQQRGVGLFYYAGHGVQIKGQNYLIPVGVDINQEFEVADESVDADAVLRAMESAGNELNIVILDACRNNPFVRGLGGSSRGLARMDGPAGTFIAYATAPGAISQDGIANRNSPYTRALLAALDRPGLSLEQVFKQVLVTVERDTGGAQIPWVASSLRGDFYFMPTLTPAAAATPIPASSTGIPAAGSGATAGSGSAPAPNPTTAPPPVVTTTPLASTSTTPPPVLPKPAGSSATPSTAPASTPTLPDSAPASGPLPSTAWEPEMVEVPEDHFAISRDAISHEAYRRFAEMTGRAAPPPLPGVENGGAVRVTWREATDYAAWLSLQTGRTYRLPTDSEWESAHRAGTGEEMSHQEREWTCSEYRQAYEGQEQRCATQLPEAVTVHGDNGRVGADPLGEDLRFRLVRKP